MVPAYYDRVGIVGVTTGAERRAFRGDDATARPCRGDRDLFVGGHPDERVKRPWARGCGGEDEDDERSFGS